MYEKFAKFSKYFLIAIVWLVIYICIQKIIISFGWNFDILSYKNWRYLNRAWQAGWKIDTFYEWAFLTLLLTLVPLYFTTLAYILHPKTYEKLKTKFLSYKVVQFVIKFLPKKPEAPVAEAAVPASTEEKKEVPSIEQVAEAEEFTEVVPAEIAQQMAVAAEIASPYFREDDAQVAEQNQVEQEQTEEKKEEDNEISSILSRMAEASKIEEAKEEKMLQKKDNFLYAAQQKEFEDIGFLCLRDVDESINLVCLSKQKIIFINFINFYENWVADEEFLGDNEPVWIGETTTVESPVYLTSLAADRILEKLQKFINKKQSVIKIVCLLKGNIQNEAQMQEIWKKKKVYVLSENKNSNLKKLSDFINSDVEPLDRKTFAGIKKLLDL